MYGSTFQEIITLIMMMMMMLMLMSMKMIMNGSMPETSDFD